MRSKGSIIVSLLLLLTGVGCDDTIDPVGVFQGRIAAYAVLSTFDNLQKVRVLATYNPPNYDPSQITSEPQIPDARVTIVSSDTMVTFVDTLIQRPDSSRYQNVIRMYYASPFVVRRGMRYTLNVASPSYSSVTSSITVPSPPTVTMDDYVRLYVQDPWYGSTVGGIKGVIKGGSGARTMVVRLYVYFSSRDYGIFREQRIEIPARVSKVITPFNRLFYPAYPMLIAVTGQSQGFSFTPYSYQATIYNNTRSHVSVAYERAVFYFYQFDFPAWNYYTVSNQFRDHASIRVDQLDYTNIQGGVGVFGSMTVDSLEFPLPSYLISPPRWEP